MGPVEIRTLLGNFLTRKFRREEMTVDMISPEPGQPVAFRIEVRDPYRSGNQPEYRRYRVTIEELPEDAQARAQEDEERPDVPPAERSWAMRNRGSSWGHVARHLGYSSPEDAQAAAEEYGRLRAQADQG